MHRTLRRLGVTSCCALACAAVMAPAAEAAASVTTLPANFVSTTSATVHGAINPDGQPVSWTFQYGPVSGPQAATYATPFQTIPPGQSNTNYEAATLFRLHPNTTYQYRLVAYFNVGKGSTYEVPSAGKLLSFTTQPTGTLQLLARKLVVSAGSARVPLKCQSHVACRGEFQISASGRGTVCASQSFSIRPGRKHAFAPRVRAACRAALQSHSGHTLRVRFQSSTTTGQRSPNRTIKLTR